MVKEKTKVGEICGKCGADIRAGSLFCYHCGGRVAEGEPEVPTKASGIPPAVVSKNGQAINKPRTQRVHRQPRTVEVAWKHSDGPGYGFLLIAFGVAALVLVLILIAYYLK